jgi:hypothetical protein
MGHTNHFKPLTTNDPAKQIKSLTIKRKNSQLDTVSLGIMDIYCSISGCSNSFRIEQPCHPLEKS